MDTHHSNHSQDAITWRNFIPLIALLAGITVLVILKQLYSGWNSTEAMIDFMGIFFFVFGSFKLWNWKQFADAYQIYDVIAQQSTVYAYGYPLIEIGLGILYLLRMFPMFTNITTLIVMLISAYGVAIELQKNRTIPCACLGLVFQIPMTYVTLAEDLIMALMALYMIYAG